jgi:hypothetical protein
MSIKSQLFWFFVWVLIFKKIFNEYFVISFNFYFEYNFFLISKSYVSIFKLKIFKVLKNRVISSIISFYQPKLKYTMKKNLFVPRTLENDWLKRPKHLTVPFQLLVTSVFILMVETTWDKRFYRLAVQVFDNCSKNLDYVCTKTFIVFYNRFFQYVKFGLFFLILDLKQTD